MAVKFLGKGLVPDELMHQYVNHPEYESFRARVEELYQQFIAEGVLEPDDDGKDCTSMEWFAALDERADDSGFTTSQLRKFIPAIRQAVKLLKDAPIVVDVYMGKDRGYEYFETILTGELYDYRCSSGSLWGLAASGEGISKKQTLMIQFYKLLK